MNSLSVAAFASARKSRTLNRFISTMASCSGVSAYVPGRAELTPETLMLRFRVPDSAAGGSGSAGTRPGSSARSFEQPASRKAPHTSGVRMRRSTRRIAPGPG